MGGENGYASLNILNGPKCAFFVRAGFAIPLDNNDDEAQREIRVRVNESPYRRKLFLLSDDQPRSRKG